MATRARSCRARMVVSIRFSFALRIALRRGGKLEGIRWISRELSGFRCCEDAVGDDGGLVGWSDVVDAEDVGSSEDGGGVGDCRGELVARIPGLGGGTWGTRLGDGAGEEAFAGDAGENRKSEGLEHVQAG